MMICSKCEKELNDSVLVCPYCNTAINSMHQQNAQQQNTTAPVASESVEKQPKKKKKGLAIGIVAAVLLLFFVIVVFTDTEESESVNGGNVTHGEETIESIGAEEQAENMASAEAVEQPSEEEKEITISQKETAVATTQKVVDTSVADFFIDYQEYSAIEFELTKTSIEVLTQKPYLFPCGIEHKEELMYSVENLPHAYITKSISKYLQTFIIVHDVSVVDIVEYDDYTYIHVMDDDLNSYVGVSIGVLPNIYDDDNVVLYGLPLDIVSFSNRGGGSTKAVFMAVCACELEGDIHAEYDYENGVVWDYGNNVGDYVADDPISYYISVHERSLGYNDLPYSYNADVGAGYTLNIRSSWSTDSEILTTVPHGTLLEWYGTYQGWAYVVSTIDYVGGWVREDLIHPTDDFYYY